MTPDDPPEPQPFRFPPGVDPGECGRVFNRVAAATGQPIQAAYTLGELVGFCRAAGYEVDADLVLNMVARGRVPAADAGGRWGPLAVWAALSYAETCRLWQPGSAFHAPKASQARLERLAGAVPDDLARVSPLQLLWHLAGESSPAVREAFAEALFVKLQAAGVDVHA